MSFRFSLLRLSLLCCNCLFFVLNTTECKINKTLMQTGEEPWKQRGVTIAASLQLLPFFILQLTLNDSTELAEK